MIKQEVDLSLRSDEIGCTSRDDIPTFDIVEDHEELAKFKATTKSMTSEDVHDLRLMSIVEQHPCIYNRSHALHKEMGYRNALWHAIAKRLDSNQLDVEKKWRHLRDKYVRLRKMDRTWQKIKPTDKWYWFYQRMSFLDHHVEHRNRKKRKHDEKDEEDIFGRIKQTLETNASLDFADGDNEDMSDGNVDALQSFYSNIINKAVDFDDVSRNTVEVKPFKSDMIADAAINVIQDCMESKSKEESSSHFKTKNSVSHWINIEVPKDATLSPSSTSDGSSKKGKEQSPEDDSEVNLFVRSIAKSLKTMDPRTFAMARIEISRVLFDCQFGGRDTESGGKKDRQPDIPFDTLATWISSMSKP